MDAEWPGFSPGSFDTVLRRLGLMFLPDLSGTLERIGALLVPGGKFSAAVWGVACLLSVPHPHPKHSRPIP